MINNGNDLKFECVKELTTRFNNLEEIIEVQCRDGNWNRDSYMHGLANGLILAYAILNNEEPKFLQPPTKWLKDQE